MTYIRHEFVMPSAIQPAIPPEVWRTLHTKWLWVYRGRPVKVNEWSQEIPVPPGAFFVEKGEVRIKADGVEHIIRPGQAFFTAPGVRQQWFHPNTRLLSVGFRSMWPDGTPLFRAGLNCVFKAPVLQAATLRLFRAIHGRRQIVNYLDAITTGPLDAGQWCQREAAFAAWFASYHQTLAKHHIFPETRASNSQRRVDDILASLEAMPLNTPHHSPLPRFSIGRRRAEQLLKAQTGLTLKAHLDLRRLREAKAALLGGTDSLKQIAHQLGFRHASHFTLWFRRQTGLTPSAFRSGGGISGA